MAELQGKRPSGDPDSEAAAPAVKKPRYSEEVQDKDPDSANGESQSLVRAGEGEKGSEQNEQDPPSQTEKQEQTDNKNEENGQLKKGSDIKPKPESPVPLVKRYMSLDVECVATGTKHDAREVCEVSVVDGQGKLLLSKRVKPEKPVVSYLTPLTGVRKGDLDNGEKLADVIKEVKALLGRNVVLVGQGVKSDIDWLELERGVDYADTVDLGEMFKAYNARYSNYSFFSLSHEANTLIRPGYISEPHSPETDAKASITLFNMYHEKPRELEQAKQKLMRNRPPPSFAKLHNYRYENVCMAAYYPAKCFCGAPTKRS